MGNESSKTTAPQNQAASEEALAIFQLIDVNADEKVTLEEWDQAWSVLDADSDGSISRKEWYLKRGTTEMFDRILKKSAATIRRDEWKAAFTSLDTDKNGHISVNEWLDRRKVVLAFIPYNFMTLNKWGIGVGSDFYEVVETDVSMSAQEMAVVGPRGIMALGTFANDTADEDGWLDALKKKVMANAGGNKLWLEAENEPRSHPEEMWESQEHVGWTAKTDAEIEEWVKDWVKKHPTYKAADPLGKECNGQTFSIDFISWLTDTQFSRHTDNTKGRAVLYGGAALVVAGLGFGLYSMRGGGKEKAPEKQDNTLPAETSTATVGSKKKG